MSVLLLQLWYGFVKEVKFLFSSSSIFDDKCTRSAIPKLWKYKMNNLLGEKNKLQRKSTNRASKGELI